MNPKYYLNFKVMVPDKVYSFYMDLKSKMATSIGQSEMFRTLITSNRKMYLKNILLSNH